MRLLGTLCLLLAVSACGEAPDPYAAYSDSEQRWLRLKEYRPGSDEADASIRWAQSVCRVLAAGGDASDIFDALDDTGWNNKREDYQLVADIGSAERLFCPTD